MKEKEDLDSDLEEDLKLIKKNEKENNGPAPGADNNDLNLNIDNIIKEKNNNNNLGIIQKPLNILIFDGSGGQIGKWVLGGIMNNGMNNGLKAAEGFDENKVFDERGVIGGNGAKITCVLCDGVSVAKGINCKDFCSNQANKYDVIVVLCLNLNSDRYVLDFIAKKIRGGNDNNLIVYGINFLSNGENMNWFKYYLQYKFDKKILLKKIASFDKSTGKFVGWDGQDKYDPNYEQSKINGLKGTAGEIAPKVNPKDNLNPGSSGRALNVLKNHYGKILASLGLFEEIVFGKVRKNLPKLFKSKEVRNKNNKDHKDVKDDKSLNNDAKKEKTL